MAPFITPTSPSWEVLMLGPCSLLFRPWSLASTVRNTQSKTGDYCVLYQRIPKAAILWHCIGIAWCYSYGYRQSRSPSVVRAANKHPPSSLRGRSTQPCRSLEGGGCCVCSVNGFQDGRQLLSPGACFTPPLARIITIVLLLDSHHHIFFAPLFS